MRAIAAAGVAELAKYKLEISISLPKDIVLDPAGSELADAKIVKRVTVPNGWMKIVAAGGKGVVQPALCTSEAMWAWSWRSACRSLRR